MIKKILPTMIGVALAGGMTAAAADVSVFGHIDESVLYHDYSPNGFGQDDSDTNLVCTTCSIGFKGSEDLGNGLKAIFSIDFQYDINNVASTATASYFTPSGSSVTLTSVSNNTIVDRDQWVGLAGGFGQVRVGTISTGYKSHGAMLDPGYRTVAEMRGSTVGLQSALHRGAGEEGQGRATNTIRWDSPDFNGIKVVAHYTVDSHETFPVNEDNNPWGIGGSYENGGILVFADYITNDRGGSDDAWKIGGKFSMDNFAVFGQYESDGGLITTRCVTCLTSNNIDGADVWFVGGSYTMGSNTIYGAYGQGDDSSNPLTDTSYDSWEIVGIHAFSKNTLAYGGFTNKDEDAITGSNFDNWTIGMKHKF